MLFVQYSPPGTNAPANNRVSIKTIDWLKLKVNVTNIIDSNLTLEDLSNKELNDKLNSIQELFFTAASTKPAKNSANNRKKKNSFWWTRELQIIRSNITNNTLFGNNYNIISNKKKRNPIRKPIVNAQGTPASTIEESTANLLDYHFPWSNRNSYYHHNFSQDDFNSFTQQEVAAVIHNIKPNKAVGVDGLPGELIKEMFLANKKWFVQILNLLVSKGHFPELWKIARVVLIQKEGKSLDHPSHFRPICILPCWGKVLDKLISDRLSYHLEKDGMLSDLQYGFRKNRSTILALNSILEFHQSAKEDNQLTCLISIDMSNVFNSVDWDLLINKLLKLHIPFYIQSIISSFLQDRRAHLNGNSKLYNKGIPQGSSLGPILWNIFINDLLETDFGPNTKVQAFADDVLIMIKAPAEYCFTKASTPPLNILDQG
ncbi:RNA-directed DNA polymerase from mobile element jockey [Caerostris darwini]|uniref:RNA-directed DNA polymerase from mobile element jockey n=1 Tax=Caerostris darwini TaxID=1538125 RepID=A0AAV4NI42_9ARAC|nr:RNA-directed DNA polymerase from mobile element jockey [Caerostris darwini]